MVRLNSKSVTKSLYLRTHNATRRAKDLQGQLARCEFDEFGFIHNDIDTLEPVIDTLDYGINSVSFEEYKRLMNEAKQKRASQ